jgi:hypothetical protein
MTADAPSEIVAALEAAGAAVAAKHEENGCHLGFPCGLTCSCADDAAAAVAAFHRRMAEGGNHMQMYHAVIAAAVERTAR